MVSDWNELTSSSGVRNLMNLEFEEQYRVTESRNSFLSDAHHRRSCSFYRSSSMAVTSPDVKGFG